MTKWENKTVNCPACCEDGMFRICTHIDAEENPELLNAVYDRSIFKFSCPECGEEILVAYNCTLINRANKFALMLIAEGGEKTENSLQMEGFTVRIVRSINAFVEKAALIEDKIDDRVIELYKIMLEDQFEEEKPTAELLGIYYGGNNPDDNTLLFYIITGNAENTRATLSMDTYLAIENQLKNQSGNLPVGCEIDREWALKVLENWKSE